MSIFCEQEQIAMQQNQLQESGQMEAAYCEETPSLVATDLTDQFIGEEEAPQNLYNKEQDDQNVFLDSYDEMCMRQECDMEYSHQNSSNNKYQPLSASAAPFQVEIPISNQEAKFGFADFSPKQQVSNCMFQSPNFFANYPSQDSIGSFDLDAWYSQPIFSQFQPQPQFFYPQIICPAPIFGYCPPPTPPPPTSMGYVMPYGPLFDNNMYASSNLYNSSYQGQQMAQQMQYQNVQQSRKFEGDVSEEKILQILKQNNNSMKVAQLMVALGADQTSPFGVAKLNQLVSNCKSLAIKGGQVFLVKKACKKEAANQSGEINMTIPEIHIENVQYDTINVLLHSVPETRIDNLGCKNINVPLQTC